MNIKNIFIYETHAKVAEFGEQIVAVLASSKEEANTKIDIWCHNNYSYIIKSNGNCRISLLQGEAIKIIE